MRLLATVGLVLIVLGIMGLVVENVSFTEKKTVLDAGPFKITQNEQKVIPIPTVAGVAAVIAGIVLVVVTRRRR